MVIAQEVAMARVPRYTAIFRDASSPERFWWIDTHESASDLAPGVSALLRLMKEEFLEEPNETLILTPLWRFSRNDRPAERLYVLDGQAPPGREAAGWRLIIQHYQELQTEEAVSTILLLQVVGAPRRMLGFLTTGPEGLPQRRRTPGSGVIRTATAPESPATWRQAIAIWTFTRNSN